MKPQYYSFNTRTKVLHCQQKDGGGISTSSNTNDGTYIWVGSM